MSPRKRGVGEIIEGETQELPSQFLSIWAYYHLFMIFYAMIKLKFLYWFRYGAALGWFFFVLLWFWASTTIPAESPARAMQLAKFNVEILP